MSSELDDNRCLRGFFYETEPSNTFLGRFVRPATTAKSASVASGGIVRIKALRGRVGPAIPKLQPSGPFFRTQSSPLLSRSPQSCPPPRMCPIIQGRRFTTLPQLDQTLAGVRLNFGAAYDKPAPKSTMFVRSRKITWQYSTTSGDGLGASARSALLGALQAEGVLKSRAGSFETPHDNRLKSARNLAMWTNICPESASFDRDSTNVASTLTHLEQSCPASTDRKGSEIGQLWPTICQLWST